ncbi:MAG: trehalose-phosphatase [Patescibacteria group bacterium]
MKNLFDDIQKIKKLIEKKGGAVLLLDFDGVLSAIAPTPDEAFISDENTALLKECAKRFPVAIITGRELSDIKKKMNIKGLSYIASHGLEWEEDEKYHIKPIPKETIKTINSAKQKIKSLISCYPGMIFEDKSFMLAIHYRIMNPNLVSKFKREIKKILKPILKNNKLRLDHNLKTFELRPEIDWDKGDSVLWAEEHFNKKTGKNFRPIYIGDSLTDEDAFTALKKDGITIRVGEKKKSAARWYLRDQKEVSLFLKWLLSLDF